MKKKKKKGGGEALGPKQVVVIELPVRACIGKPINVNCYLKDAVTTVALARIYIIPL